jgi:hypothetical protein
MYSANEEVNDALRTLERERGLGGMLESVRDAASVEGLLDIARAGPGGW